MKQEWIPVVTRPLTDEEMETYASENYEFMYNCPVPEDGQEVLITTKDGNVDKTVFYADCGMYFEGYEDGGDVTAWMPLPESYRACAE